jgi:hypothetical protein
MAKQSRLFKIALLLTLLAMAYCDASSTDAWLGTALPKKMFINEITGMAISFHSG